MTTTADVSPIDLALDLLTLDQVAAQLPVGGRDDPLFAAQRLWARGSLPAVEVAGGATRFRVTDLRDLLTGGGKNAVIRKAFNLPPEPLMPLFPVAGNWFDPMQWNYAVMVWVRDVGAEIGKQLNALPEAPAKDARVEVTVTPELRAIIGRPAPAGSVFSSEPAAPAFGNMAQLFLARELQRFAEMVIDADSMADPSNVKPTGIGQLYRSPEAYRSIVQRAIAMLTERSSFSFSRTYGSGNATVIVTLALANATLLSLSGADTDRIALLAF